MARVDESPEYESPEYESPDHESPDGRLTNSEFTDTELTALALAADPDAPIADGAVPIGIHLAQLGSALPLWYMPPVVRQGGRRWKAPFVIAVVSAFLLIDLMGLCNTYGLLTWA
jgi:hypothetical protein